MRTGGPGVEVPVGDGPRVPQAVRRLLLSSKGRNYIQGNFTPVEAPSRSREAAQKPVNRNDDRYWQVYYDTKLLVLDRQDASLYETGGSWVLQVRSVPEPGSCLLTPSLTKSSSVARRVSSSGRRVFSSEQDILTMLGADITSIEDKVSFPRRLAALGVRPIARLHCEQSFFSTDLQPTGQNGENGVKQFMVVLEDVQFDTAQAEPAHLSLLLERHGNQVRQEALRASFAEIRVSLSTTHARATTAERAKYDTRARQQVRQFLRMHGLDNKSGGSVPGSSVVVAYLRACRPAHLLSLEQAGLVIESTMQEEASPPVSPRLQRLSGGDGGETSSSEDETIYQI